MAGRAFERFWLAATALGLSLHPMSQALEVQETIEQLSQLIMPTISGEMSQVQQTFRLGYAQAPGDHTPRRPLQDVLVS
jgi:nitroreductase